MNERSLITVFEKKKYLVLIPEGLSIPEMETISTFGIITKVYKENEFFKNHEGWATNQYDEKLFNNFPDYQKLMFVKNPYWRTLEYYLWNYCYSSEYENRKTETFKKTIKSLYEENNFSFREMKNKKAIQPQNLNLTENYFLCEDFINESYKWFDVEVLTNPKPFLRIPNSSSFYDSSMLTMSDFYDKESAERVYEKNKSVFEKFGYSFYSYLDFHDPVRKIHSLHGNLTNNFEL
jgi:hypothetical protein